MLLSVMVRKDNGLRSKREGRVKITYVPHDDLVLAPSRSQGHVHWRICPIRLDGGATAESRLTIVRGRGG